jgi:hypothetical protein
MYQRKSYNAIIAEYALVFACIVLSVFFSYFPLTDTDIFWHLAAGKEIIQKKAFLFYDPFAYSLPSAQWIDLHWLFQVIVYGLYSLGNEKALLIFKLAVVACVAGILCCIHRTPRFICISAFITAVLFYETRYLLCLRPVLISILCMSLFLFLFENTRNRKNKNILWLCVPLQILWTNSQGLYIIGLFIIGAYWVEEVIGFLAKKNEKPRMMTFMFAAACLSCFVNPYGIRGILLPFQLFGRINPDPRNIFSMNIAENVPLFSLSGYDTIYRTIVIVSALIAMALFIINWKKIQWAHCILFAGFLFLAYSAERNVLLYVIVIIPIIAWNASQSGLVDGIISVLKRKRGPAFFFGCCAALILLCAVAQHAMVVRTYPPNRLLSPFRFPEKISDYLKQNPYSGNMFNDMRYGGYLMWEFYPEKKVFIDGRLIIRPPQFFQDYLAVLDNPEKFPELARKFDITQVILPWAIFDLHRQLIRWLYQSDKWRLEFTDGSSTLFVRSDVSRKPSLRLYDQIVDDVILDSISEQWKHAPFVRDEAMGYFAEMLDYLGLSYSANMVKIRARNLREK